MARRMLPIPRAIARPVLFAGCERKPVGLVGMFGFMLCWLGWMGHAVPPFLVGLALLWIGIPLLRQLAKRDPQMFATYRRHLRCRHYHRAFSTPQRLG